MVFLNQEKPIAINAINTVHIAGWIKDAQGNALNVLLQRQDLPPVVPIRAWRGDVLPNGPPPCPPSSLPSAGFNELSISVRQLIGDGRCGSVFSTHLLHLGDEYDPTINITNPGCPLLPELVIKVAEPDHSDDLRNEASMYEEMEILQGVSIPRCYGFFVVNIEPTWTLPFPSSAQTSSVKPQTLSVLLLERLGELLPLGHRVPEEGDLWDVFRDLARLGVEQTDIRYSNILFAPPSPPGLSGMMCPFHDIVHVYRVIDFDNARKTDATPKQHYYSTLGLLGPILENMRRNFIVEPWDIVGNSNRHSAL